MAIKLDGHITIDSDGKTMLATISPQEYVVWAIGAPRAYVFGRTLTPVDDFSFGRKDVKTTRLDFTLALETYYLTRYPRRIF